MELIVLKRQSQKDKELIEEPKSLIHRQEERAANDPSLGERRISRIKQPKPALEQSKDKTKGPQKKQRVLKKNQGKVEGKEDWHRPYPQGYRILKLELSAMHSVLNMARTIMEFTAKEQERMNRNFPHK
ncbi:hypothetical protein O181_007472 [Austropuccinia psidii MF-1]|uniref:Uncharacterized protein n=1 Tax=Austropuccinia psidii MF-1 TaxID=1389203 RepID=A0A9Q3GII4_9BASI|nr:hypothetical protein [Austropuccinia psidii MF-1]